MKRVLIYISLLSAVMSVGAVTSLYAQRFPERRYIRKGNRAYESQNFKDASHSYLQALAKDTTSVEAAFNMADAQYATEQFAAAENTLRNLVEHNRRLSPEQAAESYYNLGNSQFQQKKLQEAAESYKQSLRLNPSDMQAKYNLAYVKKLLEQQNKENKGGGDNQNRQNQKDEQNRQDNQQNDNGDKNRDNGNDNKPDDKQDGGQQQNPDKPKPQPTGAQPEKREVSPETSQTLGAVQQAEDRTREKVNAQKGQAVARSGKNW